MDTEDDKVPSRTIAAPRELPVSAPMGRASQIMMSLMNLRNMQRQNSFWSPGGLVSVHSDGRNREAIWGVLKSKAVYAASGERILLNFDLYHDGGKLPMGLEASTPSVPRFSVAAVGAFTK